ncbi:MAG: hypothetical protein JRN26_03935 [Nitrososphaerota archaeon]|nr:hypothetical protein [Nitrososphaerota archaeon]
MFKKKHISREKKVDAKGGPHQLTLYVRDDIDTRYFGERFVLFSTPWLGANVVAGVPKEWAPQNTPVSDSKIKEMLRSTVPPL